MELIYEILKKLGIGYRVHEHKAVFTVEEAEQVYKDNPLRGGKTKNLFLRNKKGDRHYLVVIEDSKKIDLKTLREILGESKFSFASPERLKKYLSVTPGSVSALGLVHDEGRGVKVLVDEDLMREEYINFHPNDNTKTLEIAVSDFRKFLEWWGGEVCFIDL